MPDVLYAEVLAEVEGHSARVVICTDHTRIVLMEKDGEVLMGRTAPRRCRSSPPRPTSPP